MQEVSEVYTSPFIDTDELKMALRARKVSGAFKKRAPGPDSFVNAAMCKKNNRKWKKGRNDQSTGNLPVYFSNSNQFTVIILP